MQQQDLDQSAGRNPLSPLHSAFVARAQANLPGHPGRTDGTPLHRVPSTPDGDANRAASCRGFVLLDADDSCDEYPYATTAEGGSTAAVAHVPGRDNSAGGSKLAGFIRDNRVIYGNYYFLDVID